MTEDFTSLTLAYLLDEMDAAQRADFEARLATQTADRAEAKAIADALAALALGGTHAEKLSAAEREQMAAAMLDAVRPRPRVRWERFAWPAAALVLLGLNLAQWWYFHRTADETIGLSDPATADRAPDISGIAGGLAGAQRAGLRRAPLAKLAPASAAAAPTPTIRQSLVISMTQTTAVAPAAPAAPAQQGSIDLHNLPSLPTDRRLYLWAQRTGATAFEPVGEIPRQIYGGSGTINYQLRPGAGTPVKFQITIESPGDVPPKPSPEVVCSGP